MPSGLLPQLFGYALFTSLGASRFFRVLSVVIDISRSDTNSVDVVLMLIICVYIACQCSF